MRAAAKALGVTPGTLKRWLGSGNPRLGVRTGGVKPDGPLTATGRRAAVEGMLADYPQPSALVRAKFPTLVRAAVRCGLTDDEIDAEVFYGVCDAARLYDPSRGAAFPTYTLNHMRSALKTAIGRRERDRRFRQPVAGTACGFHVQALFS